METLVKAIKKEVETIEFPFDSIHWDWEGSKSIYDNKEHTIDCEEYKIVFHLTLDSEEGS